MRTPPWGTSSDLAKLSPNEPPFETGCQDCAAKDAELDKMAESVVAECRETNRLRRENADLVYTNTEQAAMIEDAGGTIARLRERVQLDDDLNAKLSRENDRLRGAIREWDDTLTRFSRCQEHEFLAVLQRTKDTEAALRKLAREGR